MEHYAAAIILVLSILALLFVFLKPELRGKIEYRLWLIFKSKKIVQNNLDVEARLKQRRINIEKRLLVAAFESSLANASSILDLSTLPLYFTKYKGKSISIKEFLEVIDAGHHGNRLPEKLRSRTIEKVDTFVKRYREICQDIPNVSPTIHVDTLIAVIVKHTKKW